jgi:hypothetical protein
MSRINNTTAYPNLPTVPNNFKLFGYLPGGAKAGNTVDVGNLPGGDGAVASVNGQTGVVILTVAASGTEDLVFIGASQTLEIQIIADTVFTGADYTQGREIRCILSGDTVTRSLSFPAEWRFVGNIPTIIAADAVGVLSLYCRNSTASGVIAAYATEL